MYGGSRGTAALIFNLGTDGQKRLAKSPGCLTHGGTPPPPRGYTIEGWLGRRAGVDLLVQRPICRPANCNQLRRAKSFLRSRCEFIQSRYYTQFVWLKCSLPCHTPLLEDVFYYYFPQNLLFSAFQIKIFFTHFHSVPCTNTHHQSYRHPDTDW